MDFVNILPTHFVPYTASAAMISQGGLLMQLREVFLNRYIFKIYIYIYIYVKNIISSVLLFWHITEEPLQLEVSIPFT